MRETSSFSRRSLVDGVSLYAFCVGEVADTVVC
jgi:hypothetical protein